MSTSADKVASHHLRVTFRRVQAEAAGTERVLAVFCPRQARAVGLTECRQCDHCQGLCVDPSDRQTFLRCTADGGGMELSHGESARAGAGLDPQLPTTLAEVMTVNVRSVSPETSIGELTRIFLEEAISAVPVVDDRGKAIGLVSKTDVLQRYYEEDTAGPQLTVDDAEIRVELADPPATVRDIMTHIVFSLSQDAPISRAAALMSYEGIHRIVITSPQGAAVGIVSSLDILRWLARRDGYVVPGHTQRQSDPPGRTAAGEESA
ncbi:MAG: CBS domain-containing protein [Myxococcales bacterium]|nr:CBS domain-containing protein [Myxococcales bacterium]